MRYFLWGVGSLLLLVAITASIFFVSHPKETVDPTTNVGLMEREFVDTNRNRRLKVFVWYPTKEKVAPSLVKSNILFFGFSAKQNAKPYAQRGPLIILSHGSGGNHGNQGWLAVELAKRGAVVVAPNHPGSTSMDSAPSTNIQAWQRPKDIRFLIDTMLDDSQTEFLIDKARVAVVGHSLGGYTALAVAGAMLSKEAFIEYCNLFPGNPDCEFYMDGQVDLTAVDREQFEQDYKDDRVKATVALDPAYGRSFQERSIAQLPPTLLVTPAVVKGSVDDIQIDYLRNQFKAVGHTAMTSIEIDGANHFSFLQRCKPFAQYILGAVERGAHVLCAAEDKITRRIVHERTGEAIVQFLSKYEIVQ